MTIDMSSTLDQPAWGHYMPGPLQTFSLNRLRSGIRSKKIRRFWRTIALGVKRETVFDIERDGVKYRCHTIDNTSEKHFLFGGKWSHEQEIARLIAELPKGGVFFDLGANSGIFTLAAARIAGRVVSVEPNPIMLERLRFNVSTNGFANIAVVCCAVGETDSSADLHLCIRQLGKTSLHANGGETIRVPVKSLKTICGEQEITRIDALKIDIEGYEDRALLPFLRSVSQDLWPRAILTEVIGAANWREDCLHHLQEKGYAIAWRGPHDALLIRGDRSI